MSRAQLDINFGEPSFIADPHAFYEQIRATGRAVWNGTLGVWMLTSFEDCTDVLRDTGETFHMFDDPEVIFWFDAPNMITVDGGEHRRLRQCLMPTFTKLAVAKWEQRVVEVVDELLIPLLEGREDFDLIADFTKIPTVIIAELMGVPEERHEDFRHWSHVVTGSIAYGHEDPEIRRQMMQAVEELNEYLTEEIERHRRGSFDDVLSTMLELSEMSEAEMRSTAVNLLLAGYETTAKLMSIGLVALEQHPEQRRLLAEDPSLMPAAIEEVLRWVGVAQISPRVVVRDTEIAGQPIAAGEVVYAITGAANRDPARWSDPQVFDIRREQKSHLGFGYGPHLCIGLWLARLETRVAIQRLLEIAPDYRLRGIDYGTSFFVRGPAQGYVDVDAPVGSTS